MDEGDTPFSWLGATDEAARRSNLWYVARAVRGGWLDTAPPDRRAA